jgi:hypothetical protein
MRLITPQDTSDLQTREGFEILDHIVIIASHHNIATKVSILIILCIRI